MKDFTAPKELISLRGERGTHSGQGILPIAKTTTSGMLKKGGFQHEYINTFGKKTEHFVSFSEDWELPGHGHAYSDCGAWRSKGCLNVEGHVQEGLEEKMAGKVFVRRYQRTCMRAECPTCYESWAGKEAAKIQHRLRMAPKKGRPIHLIVSPPMEACVRSTYEQLRRRAYVVAKNSGFRGGSCIFHPCREDKQTKRWYFSPHFHMIGYGWIVRTKEGYEEHGWIVKNARIRKTVSGTALYQLSHAGIHKDGRYGRKTITWFGELSYNKLRVRPQDPEKESCPICGQKLRPLWYFGVENLPEERVDLWMDPEGWRYKPRGLGGG